MRRDVELAFPLVGLEVLTRRRGVESKIGQPSRAELELPGGSTCLLTAVGSEPPSADPICCSNGVTSAGAGGAPSASEGVENRLTARLLEVQLSLLKAQRLPVDIELAQLRLRVRAGLIDGRRVGTSRWAPGSERSMA